MSRRGISIPLGAGTEPELLDINDATQVYADLTAIDGGIGETDDAECNHGACEARCGEIRCLSCGKRIA